MIVAKNSIANLIGGLAGPLISLVMTPFYLRVLGLEGIGVMGLMTMMNTISGIFIAGITRTYQKEISQATTSAPGTIRHLFWGGLMVFGVLGVVIFVVFQIFGHFSLDGIAAGAASPEVLNRCIIYIGLQIALIYPQTLLASTLIALSDQVVLNYLGAGMALVLAAGAWTALSVWPRLDVLFLCQLLTLCIIILLLAARCSKMLTQFRGSRETSAFLEVWREKWKQSGWLALQLTFHEGLGVMISQVDRILITAYLPLTSLAAYNLGANPARVMSLTTAPINTAVFPEICKFSASERDKNALGEYAGRICFLLVLLSAMGLMVVIPCANILLDLWLGAGNVPEGTAECLTILSSANLAIVVSILFYNVTIAYSDVKYAIVKNLVAIVAIPLLGLWLINKWQIAGVACCALIYSLASILICAAMVYSKYANFREGRKWILSSIAVVVTGVGISAALMNHVPQNIFGLAAVVGIALIFGFSGMAISFGLNLKNWLLAIERTPSQSMETHACK